MENVNRWYYTKDQLANTPSRKFDIDYPKELSYRQQAANFIQDMGQRLQLSQLCINTAIVYMHRFYVYHSFSEVHRNNLSISALFLAAKVEEQPRKLEHVIKVAHVCLHKDAPALDVRSEAYIEKSQEVVYHENILLQSLGFVLAIEHPHTYVVKVCQLVKASKDLAQSSYLMATTSLHMTTMCIQYKPTVVACVCIHLACKWSSYLIEPCSEGREWFYYVDRTVTLDLLEKLTQEFIAILEKSPHRFKRKFGGKESAEYQNPKSLIENVAKDLKDSSEKRNGVTNKKPSSPVPSTSSYSFEFSPVKIDQMPDYVAKVEPAVKSEPMAKAIDPVPKTEPKPQPVIKPQAVVKPAPSAKPLPAAKPPPPVVKPQPKLEVPEFAVKSEPVVKAEPKVEPVVKAEPVIRPEPVVKLEPVETNNVHVSSKRSSESLHGKHERREKHKSKHSSKDRHNASNDRKQADGEMPPASLKVKIRKDIIPSLTKGRESSSLKTVLPDIKPSLKIKLPKPPGMVLEPPPPKVAKQPSTSLFKLVITKDKSGSGSYSTSHKNESSRKRSHTNSVDPNSKNHEPPPKYHKSNHQKDPHKSSRHSSHRTEANHNQRVSSSSDKTKPMFHHMPNFHPLQPPPFPTFGGSYGMPVNSAKMTVLMPPLPPGTPPQDPPLPDSE